MLLISLRKRKANQKGTGKIPTKKIKQENVTTCCVCSKDFSSTELRIKHAQENHIPQIVKYGCSGCNEAFVTDDENKTHHDWHKMFNIPYDCVVCAQTFDRLLSFSKHVESCTAPANDAYVNDITCENCDLDFQTKNLYDWHNCFIRHNAACPKCARHFLKRTLLFKHLFKCEIGKSKSQVVVEIPGSAKSGGKSANRVSKPKRHLTVTFKAEPETILEPSTSTAAADASISQYDDDGSDGMDDDRFMDSHIDDNYSDNDDEQMPDQTSNEIDLFSTLIEKSVDNSTSALMKECATRELRVCLNNIAVRPGPSATITSSAMADLPSTTLAQKPKPKSKKQAPSNQPIGLPKSSTMFPAIRIKQEPMDYNEYTAVEPPVPTPPQINIKKELLHSGYGDFDPQIARNIKRERGERATDTRTTSLRIKIQKQHGSLNSTLIDETGIPLASVLNDTTAGNSSDVQCSKTPEPTEPPRILYKKPALLAMKIKQERVEREYTESELDPDEEEDCNDYMNYDHVGAVDEEPNQSNEDIQLPVIAEVVAGIGTLVENPYSINRLVSAIINEAPNEMNTAAATNETVTNRSIVNENSRPKFIPIRIKLEPPERKNVTREITDAPKVHSSEMVLHSETSLRDGTDLPSESTAEGDNAESHLNIENVADIVPHHNDATGSSDESPNNDQSTVDNANTENILVVSTVDCSNEINMNIAGATNIDHNVENEHILEPESSAALVPNIEINSLVEITMTGLEESNTQNDCIQEDLDCNTSKNQTVDSDAIQSSVDLNLYSDIDSHLEYSANALNDREKEMLADQNDDLLNNIQLINTAVTPEIENNVINNIHRSEQMEIPEINNRTELDEINDTNDSITLENVIDDIVESCLNSQINENINIDSAEASITELVSTISNNVSTLDTFEEVDHFNEIQTTELNEIQNMTVDNTASKIPDSNSIVNDVLDLNQHETDNELNNLQSMNCLSPSTNISNQMNDGEIDELKYNLISNICDQNVDVVAADINLSTECTNDLQDKLEEAKTKDF